MHVHNPGPLNSDELKRLEGFLSRAGDRAMPLETIDGLFASLVCSPILVPPSQWLPMIWGGESPRWISEDEFEEFTGLIMRFWNSVATSINDGTYASLFSVVIDEHGNKLLMPDMWCLGFLDGMNLHEDLWLQDENLELGDLLAPIRKSLINILEEPTAQKLPLEEIIELGKTIPGHVMALREYWLDHPVADAASRAHSPRPHRAPPKAGRNDPCPCGSGKKFKHCHGGGSVH